MKEPIITFDKVTKSFPVYHHITAGIKHFLFNLPKAVKSFKNSRFEALKGISFEIYKRETFGIIGSNGAGKSTTLGLIAGVMKPTKGKIVVKGKVSSLLELGAGFHPDLTGRENIVLNAILLGMTKKQAMKRMDEIIEFSELWNFVDQPIRTYSSGMLARLGFSVAVHVDPEILLVDEILAVGDIAFQKKCIGKMLDFKKKGVTIVFVSHSMDSIENMCDRAMWIEQGHLKKMGKVNEVIREYSA